MLKLGDGELDLGEVLYDGFLGFALGGLGAGTQILNGNYRIKNEIQERANAQKTLAKTVVENAADPETVKAAEAMVQKLEDGEMLTTAEVETLAGALEAATQAEETAEAMRNANAEGIDYNGKHYTGYEATQHQRALERAMRKQKRRILVSEATGDAEKLQADQIRLQMLRQEYKRFSKAAGLRTQTERAEVTGFGYKQASAAYKANRNYQSTLEKSTKSGIMSADARQLQNKLSYEWKGEKNFIPQNAKFSKVTTIAGKGSDEAIGDIKRLIRNYGGSTDEWKKQAGKITSAKYVFDVHWYERDDGIQHDVKLKNRTEKKK